MVLYVDLWYICWWVDAILIYLMAYQPHELSNLSLAGKYFSQLSSDDISKRYYSGEKYTGGFTNRIKFLFAADSILAELNKFYAYQPVVTGTYQIYQ